MDNINYCLVVLMHLHSAPG